jgi:hypothetical protein
MFIRLLSFRNKIHFSEDEDISNKNGRVTSTQTNVFIYLLTTCFGTDTPTNFAHHCKFSKAHTGPRLAHSFNFPYVYDYITKLCRRQAEVIKNHENEYVRDIGQGEARHRLKLGGGQAHKRSKD